MIVNMESVTATRTSADPTRIATSQDEVSTCSPGAVAGELSTDQAEGLAGVLKALADPVRLRLYSRIAACGGEVCVCDIQDVGVSQPTVSHHLRKLREAGLIDCERRGTWVYYWAVPGRLDLLEALPHP